MAKDDEREEKAFDVGGDFAFDLDDDLLAEALAAVERRVQEAKQDAPPPTPPSPSELAEVAGDIELDFDDDLQAEPADDLDEQQEDPPTADSVLTDSRLIQLQTINEALLQQNEDLINEVHELKETVHRSEQRSEASEDRAKDALRKATMLVVKLKKRDEKIEVLRGRLADSRTQLRDLEPMLAELRDGLHAAESERERLKGRHVREMEEVKNFGSEKVFKSLLPVLDHFDLVMQHADTDPEKLAEGVEMTVRQLFSTLSRQGLARVEVVVGRPFDPERHEAISKVETAEHADGSILEVFQDGYTLHGRLLRAARAAVTSHPDESDPPFDDARHAGAGEE